MRRDELHEIREFLLIVQKRIEICGVVGGQREFLGRIVLDRRGAEQNDRVCARSSKVAIATLLPNTSWIQRSDIGCRHDVEAAGQHPQIVAVARAQHDAMFAERHRVRIAIFGLVMDRQQRASSSNHRDFWQSNLYR